MLFLLQFASTSFIDSFHFEEKPLKKRFPLAGKLVSTGYRINSFVEIDLSIRRKKLPLFFNYANDF